MPYRKGDRFARRGWKSLQHLTPAHTSFNVGEQREMMNIQLILMGVKEVILKVYGNVQLIKLLYMFV